MAPPDGSQLCGASHPRGWCRTSRCSHRRAPRRRGAAGRRQRGRRAGRRRRARCTPSGTAAPDCRSAVHDGWCSAHVRRPPQAPPERERVVNASSSFVGPARQTGEGGGPRRSETNRRWGGRIWSRGGTPVARFVGRKSKTRGENAVPTPLPACRQPPSAAHCRAQSSRSVPLLLLQLLAPTDRLERAPVQVKKPFAVDEQSWRAAAARGGGPERSNSPRPGRR